MSDLTKLQRLERDTNKSILALSMSALETKRLSIAASKNAEKLEAEAAKICENTKFLAENAASLAELAQAAAASKK